MKKWDSVPQFTQPRKSINKFVDVRYCTVEMKTNQTQKILEYASIEDVNVLSSLLSGATEEEINFQDKVRRSTSIFI